MMLALSIIQVILAALNFVFLVILWKDWKKEHEEK